MRKIYIAFTLAEVLITLVIIGIIAAITVPTLITKYQKEQTVVKLKKVYSAISQTIVRGIADYGNPSTWDLEDDLLNGETLISFLNKYMIPYLNILKEPTTSSIGHWNNIYYKKDNSESTYEPNDVRFYLTDGSSVTIRILKNTTTDKYLYLFVDVNGDKKPNKMGRDIFVFEDYIRRSKNPNTVNKLYPSYGKYDRDKKFEQCKLDGTGCSALIITDGWRIADDYPW